MPEDGDEDDDGEDGDGGDGEIPGDFPLPWRSSHQLDGFPFPEDVEPAELLLK